MIKSLLSGFSLHLILRSDETSAKSYKQPYWALVAQKSRYSREKRKGVFISLF